MLEGGYDLRTFFLEGVGLCKKWATVQISLKKPSYEFDVSVG